MSATNTTYAKSIELLNNLITPLGFTASTENKDNYQRVWSRDGIIAGLASLMTEDGKLIAAFRTTLDTLREFQDDTGRIASNVGIRDKSVSYGTSVGRIDATLWYIIGVTQYIQRAGDPAAQADFQDSLDKALFYLRCLELNGRGLIYIPHGGDWADEYVNHGYVLFDELLYLFALTSYAEVYEDDSIHQKSEHLRELIRVNYFPYPENIDSKYVYHSAVFKTVQSEWRPPIPVAYFTNHSIRCHIDNFAISLLLLNQQILDSEQKTELRDTVENLFFGEQAKPLLPAFHPIITEENEHIWEHLKTNQLFGFRNRPYEYHNGGLWPLVQGFFLASDRSEDAAERLTAFAEKLAADDYSFPEFYHGQTFEPGGTKHMAFSASGYIMAYSSITYGKPVIK